MAKIKKLKENGATIYPATIPQAVIDPENGRTVKEICDEFDSFLNDANNKDEVINKWREIEEFLAGISDTQTLTGMLNDTLNAAKSYTDTATTGMKATNIIDLGTFNDNQFSLDGTSFSDMFRMIRDAHTSDTPILIKAQSSFGETYYIDGVTTNINSDTKFSLYFVFNGKIFRIYLDEDYAYDGEGIEQGFISVPVASSSALGGVKVGYSANGKNYPVVLDSDSKAYVNVPWENTSYGMATSSSSGLMSAADKTKLDGIAANANKYTLPVATSSTLGGVKSSDNVAVGSDGLVTIKSGGYTLDQIVGFISDGLGGGEDLADSFGNLDSATNGKDLSTYLNENVIKAASVNDVTPYDEITL